MVNLRYNKVIMWCNQRSNLDFYSVEHLLHEILQISEFALEFLHFQMVGASERMRAVLVAVARDSHLVIGRSG